MCTSLNFTTRFIKILFAITLFNTNPTCGDFFDNFIEVSPPPPESIGAVPKCGEGVQKNKFKCVPYYNCDPLNNTIVDYPEVDGSNFIQPKFNEMVAKCGGPLEVCCQTNESVSSFEHVPTVELEFEPKCGTKNGDKVAWTVALVSSSKNELLCGGSLLSPVVVLTAAHCVKNFQPYELKIRAGGLDLQIDNEKLPYQDRDVAEIIIHEHFLSNTLYNDIALLILNSSLHEAENVGTICVPTPKIVAQNNCAVTGWDKTSYEAMFHLNLMKTNYVSMITNKECEDSYKKIIGEEFVLEQSFICARNVSGNVCIGDGGGPLVCEDSSQRYYQVGVVSWGIKCDNWVPSVFTSVVRYKDWIDVKLAELGYRSSTYTGS